MPEDGAAGMDGDAAAEAVEAALAADVLAGAELAADVAAVGELAAGVLLDELEQAAASNATGTRAAAAPTVRILLLTKGTPLVDAR